MAAIDQLGVRRCLVSATIVGKIACTARPSDTPAPKCHGRLVCRVVASLVAAVQEQKQRPSRSGRGFDFRHVQQVREVDVLPNRNLFAESTELLHLCFAPSRNNSSVTEHLGEVKGSLGSVSVRQSPLIRFVRARTHFYLTPLHFAAMLIVRNPVVFPA